MRRPDSTWRAIAARAATASPRLERLDDRAVLRHEVLAALEPPAADHLHHQVDRELAVEAREELVPGEVDLGLVEGGVRGVPLLVRDRARPSRRTASGSVAICSSEAVSTATSAAWRLEREPDVVALEERLGA